MSGNTNNTDRDERVRAFRVWWIEQHQAELEQLATATLQGYSVRLYWDRETQKIAVEIDE